MSVCLTPFYVNDPKIQGHKLPVPCGKCPPCFARRTSQWSFRLRIEGRQHMLSLFVTLTYEKPPISQNGFMTLDKTDVQKFIKRLRKINFIRYGITKKIVYYVAGEYGSTFKRPHYHLIIFNACSNAIMDAWALDNKPLGYVHIGTVSDASIGYTLKYISKKLIKKMFSRDDRKAEFQLCSKGIGLAYLTQAIIRWHKNRPAERCYAVIEDGKKISLPRYFRNKIFNDEEKTLISNHLTDIAIDREFELFNIHGKNLDEFIHNDIIGKLEKHKYKQKQIIDKL